MLAERWGMVGKDVEKAKFLPEFVSCGGNLNLEQHLKALGVHKSCFQTLRREMGKFHKNCPESLDFNSKTPLSIVSLWAYALLPSGTPSYHPPYKSLFKTQSLCWPLLLA